MIYDSTAYELGYDMFRRLSPAGPGSLFTGGSVTNSVDTSAIHSWLDTVPDGDEVYLDVESLNWKTSSQVTDADLENSCQLWLDMLGVIKNYRPDVIASIYGNFPIRTYWGRNDAWRAKNDVTASYLINHGALYLLSKIHPSCYCFYDSSLGDGSGQGPSDWVLFFNDMVIESRKYGLPIFPFTWPKFHDSNATLGGQMLPASYWSVVMQACKDNGVGQVIWDWSQGTELTATPDLWPNTKTFWQSAKPTNINVSPVVDTLFLFGPTGSYSSFQSLFASADYDGKSAGGWHNNCKDSTGSVVACYLKTGVDKYMMEVYTSLSASNGITVYKASDGYTLDSAMAAQGYHF